MAAGGAKSSRKGVPNRSTREISEKLHEMGCEPIELAVKIAMGQELDGPHPVAPALLAFVDKLSSLEEKGGAVTPELVEGLRSLIEDNLMHGHVSYDLRWKAISELLSYAYPRRKPVDADDKADPSLDGRVVVLGFVDAEQAQRAPDASES